MKTSNTNACFKILYEKSTARFKKKIRTGKINMANLYNLEMYSARCTVHCTVQFRNV